MCPFAFTPLVIAQCSLALGGTHMRTLSTALSVRRTHTCPANKMQRQPAKFKGLTSRGVIPHRIDPPESKYALFRQ